MQLPFILRTAAIKLLQQTHLGQFGMKSFSSYAWWPHITRMIYFHGKNCSDCIKAGKNLQPLIPEAQYNHLPEFKIVNEEFELEIAGPLDSSWGLCNYILICIDRISKFPSAKISSSTSTETVIEFLTDCIHLH